MAIYCGRSRARARSSPVFSFRTSQRPIEIPGQSHAARPELLVDGRTGVQQPELLVDGRTGVQHPAGVWFREPVQEMTVFSEQYDFVISLLTLEDRDRFELSEEPVEDSYDRFRNRER